MLLEGGRQEGPELPEDDRQRQQEGGPEADPDRRREGLDRAEGHRLTEALRQGLVEPVEDLPVEGIGDDESDGDRGQGDDQARAKLAKVLDEGGLLAVAKAPGQPGHVSRWAGRAATRRRGGAAARPSRRDRRPSP